MESHYGLGQVGQYVKASWIIEPPAQLQGYTIIGVGPVIAGSSQMDNRYVTPTCMFHV